MQRYTFFFIFKQMVLNNFFQTLLAYGFTTNYITNIFYFHTQKKGVLKIISWRRKKMSIFAIRKT